MKTKPKVMTKKEFVKVGNALIRRAKSVKLPMTATKEAAEIAAKLIQDSFRRGGPIQPQRVLVETIKSKALERQVGGDHYKMPIQHAEFCQKNKLGWCESSAIKYIVRHGRKNGAEDIKKAIHYLEILLELEYPLLAGSELLT